MMKMIFRDQRLLVLKYEKYENNVAYDFVSIDKEIPIN